MKTSLISIAACVPLLIGCAGVSESLESVTKSKAIGVLDIQTMYGRGKYIHIGMTNVDVHIAPDSSVTIGKKP